MRTALGLLGLLGLGGLGGLMSACADPPAAPAALPAPPDDEPTELDAYQGAAPRPDRPPPPLGVVSAIDPGRGTPRVLWPVVDDRAPRASDADTGPVAAARAALASHAAAYRLDAAGLATVVPTLVHDTGRGPIIVRLGQRVDDIEVWPDRLAVVLRRDLTPVALIGGLAPAAGHGPPARFPLTADAAARAVLADPDLAIADDADAALAEPARIRPVLYALPDRLVPAYLSEIRTKEPTPRGWRHVVAADDGRVLHRQRLDADAFAYRVWADPDGDQRPADGPFADATPHPTGLPDGFVPALTAPALVTVDGLDVHGDPWLPAGATESRGNNVDAYADLAAPSGFGAGDVRATTTAPGRFDRAFDLAVDPAANLGQRQAAVAQVFYVLNWLHDVYYDAGFDEAAGNAQQDNLGRGGVAGDPLLAEVDDYAGFANASMFVPADGASPRLQVFLFPGATGGGPRTDGGLDAMLISHEWGHYLHRRLVECSGAMCNAMGEGWADFVALHLVLGADDPPGGAYPFAPFASRGMYANATYFGLRRYPFATDRTRSPLTLRHLRIGEPLPAGVPVNPLLASGSNFDAHNAGEVWALALFEALAGLAGEARATPPRYSFAEARRRMTDAVVAGMIAAPVNPDLTEQRDAILAAVAAGGDLRDLEVMATGFARRGLGSAAVSPPATTTTGLGAVESFTIAGRLGLGDLVVTDDGVTCDGDGVLDDGEVGAIRIVVANLGVAPLTGPALAVSSPTAGVDLPGGGVAVIAALAPFERRVVSIPIALSSSAATAAIVVELRDAGAVVPVVTRSFTRRINLDVAPTAVDDLEAPTSRWTATTRWARVTAPMTGNTTYAAPAVAAVADERLVSPPIAVAVGGPLHLGFRHRYALTGGGGDRDGAVVEYSRDGQTWLDVATLTDPGYTATLAPSGNPLAGRRAYAGQSPGYPAFAPVDLDLGAALAGETVWFRFRLGTDAVRASAGWEVDDIAVTGAAAPPFLVAAPEDGVGCTAVPTDAGVDAATDGAVGPTDAATDARPTDAAPPDGPTVDAGPRPDDGTGGCCQADGARPSSRLLPFALAALLARRRRRRRC